MQYTLKLAIQANIVLNRNKQTANVQYFKII